MADHPLGFSRMVGRNRIGLLVHTIPITIKWVPIIRVLWKAPKIPFHFASLE